jgi:HK97 family phage major capsid protein/HK97 family phage prohead protease
MALVAENPVDLDKRLVRMSFSSETPILRRVADQVYYERLSHETSAILSDRLNNRSVPFLDGHDWDKVGGKVIEYEVRGDKGYATVKMSRNPIGIEMLNDISDGVRTEISVGYKVEAMRKIGEREGKEEYLVTKWMPYEVSLVGVPADHSVGIGRSSNDLFPVEIEGEERADKADDDDHYSKYGDVEYADKKNHKYPIDTKKHAQAAWSYINMPKNAAKYSSSELSTIKGRIKAAAKKFGIEVSDERGASPEEAEKVVYEVDVVSPLDTTREISMAEPSTAQPIEVVVEHPDKIREAELTRSREILAVGTRFNALKEAEDFVRSGKPLAEFNAFVLAEKVNTAPLVRTADPFVGTSLKEAVRYNLAKAILEGHEKISGFEREMSQEIGRQVGRNPSGMFIPEFALMPVLPYASGAGIRAGDLIATGSPSAGGNLIQTSVDTTLVPFLRSKMVTGRMGCTMFTGLVGNFALPRQTSTATATWNSENNDPARSGQTFDQVVFQPQRLSAVTAFSKWLLQQAQVDTQTVVRDDLLETVAHANDSASLYGTGINNQPVGIFATTADTVWPSAYTKTSPSVTFGSGYPTWSKVVQFEGAIESNNIDLDNSSCGYVTSPNVKTLWKTMAKVDPRATNQFFPSFIWEDGPGGGAEGRVNGFKALATNQITNDKVVFGRWSDLVIAQWGGIDLLTDPYTLASSFQIRIIINLMTDIDMRYAPAFCYSTDTGLFK